jgi:hypothetical protein
MTTRSCAVKLLEENLTGDEINGDFNDFYLKAISRCKCPDHINLMPVKLPSFNELHSKLCEDLTHLLEWNLEYLHNDQTGNHVALHKFITEKCLGKSPDSLFSILFALEAHHT